MKKLQCLNWHDVLFLLNTGYFKYKDAVEYAKIVIGDIPEHEEALTELLLFSPIEIKNGTLVKEHVVKLANNIDEFSKQQSFDKIMFLLLSWIYDHKDQFDEPLDLVALAVMDFGYPELTEKLCHPYSLKEDEFNAVYRDWERYLRDEAQRWGRGIVFEFPLQ